MLPILATAIQNLGLDRGSLPQIDLPMRFEKIESTPTALHADNVLTQSQMLLACYKTLEEIQPADPSTVQMQKVFNEDIDETRKAFQAAKAVTMNQLTARLTKKHEPVPEGMQLTKVERHLGEKVLKYGKEQDQNRVKAAGPEFGALLYNFGKVVGKLQNLVD